VIVALDEQIFAVQNYGGISRNFYEQVRVMKSDTSSSATLEPLRAPIVNEFLLQDDALAQELMVSRAHGPYTALARFLTRRRRKSHVDVVHNTFYLPGGLSDYPFARRVATVHDMIPELLPHSRRKLDFLTRKARYIHSAHHIVCVSESTRADLLQVFPALRTPITVSYPGVTDNFHPQQPPLERQREPYLLHVGNRGNYKDGITLLRAFLLIANRFPDHQLLLVGGEPLTREEIELINGSVIDPRRIVQLSLPERLIVRAYAHATVTVFPSRYEGFGLPAVEAMASGSPLILANTSSLPEVGGDAAIYFTPGSVTSLVDALLQVLADDSHRSEMSDRGIKRARSFTWDAYTRGNLLAYQQATE